MGVVAVWRPRARAWSEGVRTTAVSSRHCTRSAVINATVIPLINRACLPCAGRLFFFFYFRISEDRDVTKKKKKKVKTNKKTVSLINTPVTTVHASSRRRRTSCADRYWSERKISPIDLQPSSSSAVRRQTKYVKLKRRRCNDRMTALLLLALLMKTKMSRLRVQVFGCNIKLK